MLITGGRWKGPLNLTGALARQWGYRDPYLRIGATKIMPVADKQRTLHQTVHGVFLFFSLSMA